MDGSHQRGCICWFRIVSNLRLADRTKRYARDIDIDIDIHAIAFATFIHAANTSIPCT
jgi:hypothetical protein